jgi:multidrug efflux pump subunit AcrB
MSSESIGEIASLLLGVVLVTAAAVVFARPMVIEWLYDRSNLRTARWLSNRGFDWFLRDYPNDVRRAKRWAPLLLLLIGVAFIAAVFTN